MPSPAHSSPIDNHVEDRGRCKLVSLSVSKRSCSGGGLWGRAPAPIVGRVAWKMTRCPPRPACSWIQDRKKVLGNKSLLGLPGRHEWRTRELIDFGVPQKTESEWMSEETLLLIWETRSGAIIKLTTSHSLSRGSTKAPCLRGKYTSSRSGTMSIGVKSDYANSGTHSTAAEIDTQRDRRNVA